MVTVLPVLYYIYVYVQNFNQNL